MQLRLGVGAMGIDGRRRAGNMRAQIRLLESNAAMASSKTEAHNELNAISISRLNHAKTTAGEALLLLSGLFTFDF